MSIKEAIEKALDSGGITYCWYTGKEITRNDAMQTSFVFAACPNIGVKPLVGITSMNMFVKRMVVERVSEVIGKYNEHGLTYIGIWVEKIEGTFSIHVDAVRMFESENLATEFCKNNNQLAYYDFVTERSVYVGKKTV
jgi:hypothetical protein